MSALCYKITSFDCDIQHIVGEDNFIADYLSRNIIDDTSDNDDKNDTAKNVPKTATDEELTDGIKSLSLDVPKSKQTSRAGTKMPAEKAEQQTEDSADEQDNNQNKTNNK